MRDSARDQAYQRQWRAEHPDYNRDYKRKKKHHFLEVKGDPGVVNALLTTWPRPSSLSGT